METITEEVLFVKAETFFDQLLNWSLGIAAVFQILCLICVGFAASGSRNKGRSTTVRPLNCRCCSRSATRLSAATRGASEEATSNASATNVNSTTIASRDQRRTSATSSNQARHGRHHRRRNR
ncbi:uncharacterized protein LOC111273052 [Varroa jacobsoni]|uniref:Uncharacterized protein n=1 Tax=Varroa destructor TaxID=109461 RepID=A0A7M7K8B3_VARDE|nr:uncharacterized protein LOC111251103 [Varroa destructor]XP_022710480.1 uncharacterized protein LOC111273052 [Varroa jacobsoni]